MKESHSYQYIPSDKLHMYPLFKFMKKQHAQRLLTAGEVHLPNMYSFKGSAHGGLIDDSGEGQLRNVRIPQMNVHDDIKMNDILIYCTTDFLLSDSLAWAIEDGKDSCVMIIDSERFFRAIADKLGKPGTEFGACMYYKLDDNTMPEEVRIQLPQMYYLKQQQYKMQREVRAVFFDADKAGGLCMGVNCDHAPAIQPETVKIPEIVPLLKEITFDQADREILLGNKSGTIIMKVIRCEGAPSTFTIQQPRELFSPVFIKGSEGQLASDYLGFFYPNCGSYTGATVEHCDIGFMEGAFVCNRFANVDYLEIATEG